MVKSGTKSRLQTLLNAEAFTKMNLVETIFDGIGAQMIGSFRCLYISLTAFERKLLFYAHD
jgi:hypothetical protein